MARYNDVLVFSFLALQFTATFAQVDRTLEDGATGTEVVIATVERIRSSGIFPNDHQFLRRMARVKSNDGEATETIGGIWNVARSDAWRKLQRIFRHEWNGNGKFMLLHGPKQEWNGSSLWPLL